MPWAALDDGFHDDPRTLSAGLAAAGLYACAMSYVARYLLDGIIPRQALLRMLEGGDMAPLDALMRVGYVEQLDDDNYYLPDYLKPGGNVSREQVEQRRKDAHERKQRWAEAQAKKKRAAAKAKDD